MIRPVQPWRKMDAKFFGDVDLARAERQHTLPARSLRFVFSGLWAFSDDAGRFEWDAMVLRAAIAPFEADIDEAMMSRILGVLAEGRWIRQYVVEGRSYGLVKNWTQYQVKHPDPRRVIYPAPTDQLALSLAHAHERAHDRVREQVPDRARVGAVRDQQQEEQQDHPSDRRRPASRAPTREGPTDDDDGRVPVPGWVVTLFGAAFGRAATGSELMLLGQLLAQHGEPRMRAALERLERQARKGKKIHAIAYLVSTVDDLHRGDTLPDGHAVRPVGGLSQPTDEMRAAWEAEAAAAQRAMELAPPCPRCGGTGAVDGVECQAWGAAYADEPEDWRCRSGRRVAAEDYELEMLTETRGRWRCPPQDTEETHGVA